MSERQQRRTRLTPEQKWQIFLGVLEEEPHRRRGMPALGITPGSWGDPRARQGGRHRSFGIGPGRPRKDAQMTELERGGGADLQGPKEVVLTFPWVARR